MSSKSYCGSNESSLLRQAHAENPDGFEILSIKRSGALWWRKVTLLAQPLAAAPQQEMSKIRLLSAIYSERERRLHMEAQREVLARAYDFDPQRRA